jgi:hypothetical protein
MKCQNSTFNAQGSSTYNNSTSKKMKKNVVVEAFIIVTNFLWLVVVHIN